MINVDAKPDILTLTLCRPEKANALNEAMLRDMTEAIVGAKAKLLILTGEGKVFSAGADLEDVATGGLATSAAWEDLSSAVAGFSGLSVAALNGTAAGGSLGMVLACDLRIAVPSAKFFYPVMKLGYLPQPSDPRRLAALVGPARAKLMLMGGQKIDAERALSFGLVDELAHAPLARVHEIAEHVLAASCEHATAIKALIG